MHAKRRKNTQENHQTRYAACACEGARTNIFDKAREIEQLRQSLRGYADYDEIKRELEIMKVWGSEYVLVTCSYGVLQYVEFAGLEGDLDEEDGFASDNQLGLQLPNPNASKANAHPASSLEALLATKNKRILEELTKFRVGPPLYSRCDLQCRLSPRSYITNSKHHSNVLKMTLRLPGES